MFGVSVAKNPGTYLGITSLWGKTRMNALSYVKERLISKLKHWIIWKERREPRFNGSSVSDKRAINRVKDQFGGAV